MPAGIRFNPTEFAKRKELLKLEVGLLAVAIMTRGVGRELVQQTPVQITDFTNLEQTAYTIVNNAIDTYIGS